jgi:hypothetical protein
MYSRADLTLDHRMEIVSRFWRFGEEHGTATRLAQEFRTSRRLVYDLAERVKDCLDWRQPGRPAQDNTQEDLAVLRQRIRELEADCEQLSGQLEIERERAGERRFRLLLELALCPVSEDKIARCLEAALGRAGRVSSGWVNGQLQRAGEAALAIMRKKNLRESVTEAAIDELFRHRQPILCVIDPLTLLATVPEAAENRTGETWQSLLKQYPNLKFVVSDQASGLRKGVTSCEQAPAHQYDTFHIKREIKRWLRSQEARCYEQMEKIEQARRLIDDPRLGAGAQIRAYVDYKQQAMALDERLLAFDWTEVIVKYLEESLTVYDARRHRIRSKAEAEALVDEVLGLLKEIRPINTKPLIGMIEGARRGLFTFLQVAEEKLNRIEVRWRHVSGSRGTAFNAIAGAWHYRPQAHTSEKAQRAYLTALINLQYWTKRIENFPEVQRQIYEALGQVVRASSAVECFNSLLRPYISVKKHLSQGFLALIALYHNTRPLKQRGNRTPLELAGVDLGDNDWVRLIEHEMRYGQAAAEQIA